jgi:hypothetical protein
MTITTSWRGAGRLAGPLILILASLILGAAAPLGPGQVGSLNALKALSAGQYQIVVLYGNLAAGDQTSREYSWSGTACPAPDDLYQVSPSAGSGCWLWVGSGQFQLGITNFIQPAGTYGWGGNIANSPIAAVLGTASSPNNSADAALTIQRIGAAVGVNPTATGGLFSATDNGGTIPGHMTSVTGLTQSSGAYAPGTGTFFEGGRGQCDLLTGSRNAQCEGVAAEVNFPVGTTGQSTFGAEGAVNNNSGVNPSTSFNPTSFSSSFIASCGDHGAVTNGAKCENGYIVNPNNAYPFLRGFLVPLTGTTLDQSAGVVFQIGSQPNGANWYTVAQGFKMDSAVFTSAAITLPNGGFGAQGANAGIRGENAAGNNLLSLLYLDNNNYLNVGVDAAALALGSSTGWTAIAGVLALVPRTWADNQSCAAGEISVDATYLYVCTATNTVKRVTLTAF